MIAAIYARKSTHQSALAADEQKSAARQVEHAKAYSILQVDVRVGDTPAFASRRNVAPAGRVPKTQTAKAETANSPNESGGEIGRFIGHSLRAVRPMMPEPTTAASRDVWAARRSISSGRSRSTST